MARPRKSTANKQTFVADGNVNKIKLDFGEVNPKQAEFFKSKALYTGYGGARGGGKSWAVQRLATLGCVKYAGIRVLIVRRQYSDLLENHIEPLKKFIPQDLAEYNNSTHIMYFINGSTIKFGHFNYDSTAENYQGQEYDWIFMDEATQFTEHQFRMLGGCLRGVNKIPKRFYVTCNPGGIGHRWVKRLFIDRDFKTDSENPEENENPKDYKFIFASVEDNEQLMKHSPAYVQMLSSLPEKMRAAHRYGDWDALGGAYFDEFTTARHVVKPFPIPDGWRRYRAFDYGLDMFACYWVAVDTDGRSYVYREFCQPELIVKDAAKEIHSHTLPSERIEITFAPPDMWNRQRTDGKTMAEDFLLNDVSIIKVANDRAQGALQMKNLLADMGDGKPGLLIFDNCKRLIDDLAAVQCDEKDPNKYATEPHDVTHAVDALRYYCVSRQMPAVVEKEREDSIFDDDDSVVEDYDSYLAGGEVTQSYLSY